VIEARQPEGDMFGVERLSDLLGRYSSDRVEPEEIVRQIVSAILEYEANRLDDDATLVLVRWNGYARRPRKGPLELQPGGTQSRFVLTGSWGHVWTTHIAGTPLSSWSPL
jgi:hypothetical protein